MDGRSTERQPGQPKSQHLREVLLEHIRGLPPGAVLPTERELCAAYHVSRATVRAVLQQLESEQRIYRRQGKGTFVASAKIEQRLGLTSQTEDMRASGIRPGSKLIDVSRVPASSEVGAALRLAPGTEVLQIERLLHEDGEPIAIEVLYLDAARFDGISSALGEDVFFYQLLSSDYGVELASAEETIEATVAGPREAKLLRCGNAAALLLLSRLTFDTTGRPVEYVRSHYRGDRFRFRQRLERHGGKPTATGDPLLREATAADAAALAWVFISAWRDAYPGIVDDAVIDALDEAQVTDWLGNIVSAGSHRTVVAESPRGKVVGFIGFGAEPDDPRKGHVFSLYTHPSAGRRGIGRKLLEHALESLADRGRHTVTLWVFEGNERALGLYRSAGFQPDGGRRVEPEYGAQEIRLVRIAPDAPPEPGILAVDLAAAGA